MLDVIEWLIDFIFSGSFWDLIFNIFGLGLIFGAVIVFFPLYRPLVVLIHAPPKRPRGLPPDLLRGIISIILALVAGFTAFMRSYSLQDVIHSVLPLGDYVRIGETFSQQKDPMLFNQISDVFMREMILAYIFILPVILIDCLNGASSLFTREDTADHPWRAALLNAVSVISTLVILSCYDTPQFTLPARVAFLALDGGILNLIFFGVLMIALLGLTLIDILANNYILSIFAFHVAKRIVSVPLERWQETVFIILCLTVGYVADVIRKQHEDYDDLCEITTYFSHGGVSFIIMTGTACVLLLCVRHIFQ